MREVMVALTDRLPTPLLTFLGVHEQSSLGFTSLKQLQKLSEINLVEGTPEVRVISNQIIVHDDIPKVFYKV